MHHKTMNRTTFISYTYNLQEDPKSFEHTIHRIKSPLNSKSMDPTIFYIQTYSSSVLLCRKQLT